MTHHDQKVKEVKKLEMEVIYGSDQGIHIITLLKDVTDVQFFEGVIVFYSKKKMLLGVTRENLIHFHNTASDH